MTWDLWLLMWEELGSVHYARNSTPLPHVCGCDCLHIKIRYWVRLTKPVAYGTFPAE